MNKLITFKGTNHAIPQSDALDGACQEIINMRYRKGAWRPVGAKNLLPSPYNHTGGYTYNGNPITLTEIFLHDIESGVISGEPNWIGLVVGNYANLYSINPATKVCTLIEGGLNADTPVTVVFLKLSMIVTTGLGLFVYLFDTVTKLYGKIGSLPVPYVDLYCSNTVVPTPAISYPIRATTVSAFAHTPEAVLGELYATLNTQSSSFGRLYGSIMYMVAYRLFDGSYIMHSIPRFKELSNGGTLKQNNPTGSGWDNAQWRWSIETSAIVGMLVNTNYPSVTYDKMKDIVDSIVVFATKATPIYKVDDTTVIETLLQAENYTGYNQVDVDRLFSTLFPLNSPDFEDLAKSTGWYQILEYPFSEVVGASGTNNKLADTTGFYQDYATRKALPADQFSHHGLVSKEAYIYNDRLHIGNVKTIFGDPFVTWAGEVIDGYTQYYDAEAKIIVRLSTSLGKATVVSSMTIPRYRNNSTGVYYYLQPGIIGYNDSRATKMDIVVNEGGTWKVLMSVDLKKNEGMNFAYYHKLEFSITPTATNNYNPTFIAALGADYTVPDATITPFDPNRLQVSEIQNPLVYPAANSYQVGTGEIIAICSGSEPLSVGQFGQFPLQVFTSKGIFAMAVGTGDVLYTNILPSSAEVANNRNNIIPVSNGVVYSTELGLYIINGRDVAQISEVVEGTPLGLTSEISLLFTDARCTPRLSGKMSTTDFLTFLETSIIGYDQINKELIVTNNNSGYTYVFNFESKLWTKLSQSYTLLINSYPNLYGVTESGSDLQIRNISDEAKTGCVDCLIVSRALSFELPGVYKKIDRLIARTKFKTDVSMYAGLYLFASDDLITWQLITGKQRTSDQLYVVDMVLQRSAGSAKYYIVVLNGRLSMDSEITDLDLVFSPKWTNKLR